MGTGDVGERLQVVLAGDDADVLEQTSRTVERELRARQNVGNITSNASLQRPEIHLSVDFARAADLGVTTAAMASAVRVATAGDFEVQLPKLNLPQRQIPIRVRLDPELRQHLNAISQLRVAGWAGQVPLNAGADVRLGSGPAQIDRLDRQRNVTIDVELAGRPVGEVLAQAEQLPSLQRLPRGVSRPVSGDAERMAEVFDGFGSAMLTGVLCIYIVLVEYAVMARREHGMDRPQALVDACRKRVRPIVMTTIAMVAGMLPIALGIGAEPSFRAPMAIAVIGGLLTSTLLSLLVIPVVFTYAHDLLGALRGLGRRLQGANPGVPAAP